VEGETTEDVTQISLLVASRYRPAAHHPSPPRDSDGDILYAKKSAMGLSFCFFVILVIFGADATVSLCSRQSEEN
jgi:hypothetical protein